MQFLNAVCGYLARLKMVFKSYNSEFAIYIILSILLLISICFQHYFLCVFLFPFFFFNFYFLLYVCICVYIFDMGRVA